MNIKKLCIFLTLPLTMPTGVVEAATIFEEINLHTMLESTTSVFTTLGDYSVLNPDGITNGTNNIGDRGISWEGSYNDLGWNYTATGSFGGVPLSMNYSGSLSGSDGSDITVTIAGNGFLGSQPLTMNGSTEWFYDIATDDYLTMDFAQETQIGSDSWWGWVLGGEIVLGVGAGVVSGLIAGGAITLGTGGAGTPAGVGTGIKVGATVAGLATVATTTVSNNAKSILAEDKHPAPTRPTPPPTNNPFVPSNQGTLVADNGDLFADDMFNRYRSSGSYAGGTFSGITRTAVPEPSSILSLFILGTLGTASTLKRKLKTPKEKKTNKVA